MAGRVTAGTSDRPQVSAARRRGAWLLLAALLAAGAGYAISAALSSGAKTGASACSVSELSVSEYGASASAGTALVLLRIGGAGGRTCLLSAAPVLRGEVNSGGRTASARHGVPVSLPSPPGRLVVDGRHAAAVLLSAAGVPVGGQASCSRLTAVRFSLRGSDASLPVRMGAPLPLCGGMVFGESGLYPLADLAPAVRPLGRPAR